MRLLVAVLISASLLPFPAFAEIKTITHTIQQPFGGSQSPDDARIAGIARAKREALEQFGTYIESATVVKESRVDSDEILALTAGVAKAEVIKQRNYTDGDAFGIEISVKVEIDTAVLESSLKRLLEDRNHLKDLKAAREREKKLLARIAELVKENRQKGKTEQQAETIKEKFHTASQGLIAVEWFDKAIALWDGKKYSEPKKAIEYLSLAIHLDPSDSAAYSFRGETYRQLNQFERAIADYDQAIRLKPNNATVHLLRGIAYIELKQFERAITDFDQVIRLDPNDWLAYYNRGNSYSGLEKYTRAIADFDQVIRLKPNFTATYTLRGILYYHFKQFDRAIADFNQAIRLTPTEEIAYSMRGRLYYEIKQYDRAIADFDQAIQLKPNNAAAYHNRGATFFMLDKDQKACEDLKKACDFGDCDTYEKNRQEKLCR